MEREILFRGKRVDNGEWVEGYVREIWASKQEDCRYVICPSKSYENDGWADSEETEVIPETVSQFTGLTDKNGKKIFEGDICLHGTCGGIQTNSVEFYKYGFFVGDYPVSEDCEVVGNVYDNPELLKK